MTKLDKALMAASDAKLDSLLQAICEERARRRQANHSTIPGKLKAIRQHRAVVVG